MAGRGWYLAVTKNDVERLMAISTPFDYETTDFDSMSDDEQERLEEKGQELWEFFCQEIDGKSEEEFKADIDKAWDPIHRCLTGDSLFAGYGPYPLNKCVMGGLEFVYAPDRSLKYVTPEEVKDVDAALSAMTEEWFRQQYFNLDFTLCDDVIYGHDDDCADLWIAMGPVKYIFRKATETGRAVVFFASW